MNGASTPILAVTSDASAPTGLGWHDVELSGAPVKLARFTVEPGHATPVDSHAVHEVWLVAAGTGELRYDGSAVRLTEGDAVYFAPHRTHEVRNDGPGMLVVHSVYWAGRP